MGGGEEGDGQDHYQEIAGDSEAGGWACMTQLGQQFPEKDPCGANATLCNPQPQSKRGLRKVIAQTVYERAYNDAGTSGTAANLLPI